MSVVPVQKIPGWGNWPVTVYDKAANGLRTTGELEPPGPFGLQAAVYVAGVIAVLWHAIGPPDEIAGRWTALAIGVEDDHGKAWGAMGVIAAAVPLYLWGWKPAMVRLLGSRFNVLVTEQEVRVCRGWPREDVVYDRRLPLQLSAEAHRKGRLGKRHWGGTPYLEAIEVVLFVGEERTVVVQTVKEQREKAGALVLRLQTLVNNYEVALRLLTGTGLRAQEKDLDEYH